MRRLFTTAELRLGMSKAALEWANRTGRLRRVVHGMYAEGPEPPTELDRQVALVVRAGGEARGRLAAVLHGLDGIQLAGPQRRHTRLPEDRVVSVAGVAGADGFQTLVDLAALVDDKIWEQAVESALRKRLTTVAELEAALPALGRARTPGVGRIRRVLARRPPGAPATESLLETLMVQLARGVDGLPPPTRQHKVTDEDGVVIARVDLCWPDLGLFIELDGQHHKDQPVHDARRETAVVAATGWLCGRFTWREVAHLPTTTRRRLAALAAQARRRPTAT